MDWDRLRSYDELMQSELADGHYRGALEALVQGYQHAIVGFCYNMLGDRSQAEELAQDIFLDAYKSIQRFRQQSSVRTWLFAIARNKCLQTRRNRTRRGQIVQEKQEFIAQGAHREAPTVPGDDLDVLTRQVKQGLMQLPVDERSVLTMRYDTGLSVAEMSAILKMSTATVRRRLSSALTSLREVIDGDG